VTDLPRALCPICGRDVALRRGGELRLHPLLNGDRCPGAGLTVLEAAMARADSALRADAGSHR
jgi:hypothetical protein